MLSFELKLITMNTIELSRHVRRDPAKRNPRHAHINHMMDTGLASENIVPAAAQASQGVNPGGRSPFVNPV